MKVLIFMLLTLLLPSCMVGPTYVRPSVTIPSRFQEAARDVQDEPINLTSWWELFSDDCLTELIQRATDSNFDFKIACARIEEVSSYYAINRAKLFPEADGALQLNREHYSASLVQNEFLRPNQLTTDFLRTAVEVLWEIDLWGRLRRASRAAYAEYEATIEDARGIYIMMVSNIATAYIDLRALEKNIHLVKDRVQIDTKLLSLQNDRFDAGIDSKILVQQSMVQLEESRSQLPLLELLYAQTQQGLALLLGEFPEGFEWGAHDTRYAEKIPIIQSPLRPGLPSELLRRRPDIRQAERLLAAATERIGEAIADFFPRFPLLCTIGTASSSSKSWFAAGSLSWLSGVTTRWPLLNFGRVTCNIQAKTALQKQALLRYGKSVVAAFGDVEDALASYYKLQERVDVLTSRSNLLRKERDLSLELVDAGLADQTAYLLTQKSCIDIERLLNDAQRSVSIALVTLYKALGGGWAEGDLADV